MRRMKHALVLALAGALAVSATNELRAAPGPSNSAVMRQAAANAIVDVRWGGGGWHGGGWGGGWRGGWGGWRGGWGGGWWWPGAVIGGLALGTALAAPYYYGCPWGYGYCGYPYPYRYWGPYGY